MVTQIENILETVSLGEHYFDIALLLRESLLINSMLSSVEIMYGLKASYYQDLESVDKLLLRKVILKTKVSTPYESLFLELGIIPLHMVIEARRILNTSQANTQDLV